MSEENKKKKLIFLDNGANRIPNWLKEVERRTKMSRELETFGNKVCPNNCIGDCKECELVAKKLKALEIIKEKRVDVCWIIEMKNKTLKDYNGTHVYELTEEEYDLLKEVLL